MAILYRNPSRWIPRSVLLLLILLLLQSVPYGSSQTTPPGAQTRANDPVVIVIAVMFFVIFVMVFGSIFCRRSNAPFYSRPSVFRSTDADAEARVVRIRRNTARGLDAEAIESFPTFTYSEVKAVRIGKGGVECAVCLCEFEDDETLRLMPPCSHVFHADCVDVWLSGHSTCPLCRADLLLRQGESTEIYLVPDPGTVSSSSGTGTETGRVLEYSDAHLLDSVTWTNSNTTPRSKSTGLSSWRISGILFPRSHSTGHSLVRPAENLDRFTLRLPDDVRRQLMKTRTTGRVALPQARSSRSGYRSGSVGSYGRKNYNNTRRLHSLSFSFSFRSGSVRSTFAGYTPKNLPTSIESGERSFERLRPDDQV